MASTTDPHLKSFIPAAAESHFPIQNLPFGVFRPPGEERPRVGVAIGEQILDLSVLDACGMFDDLSLSDRVFDRPALNDFLSLGRDIWRSVRMRVSQLLQENERTLQHDGKLRSAALVPQEQSTLLLPVDVGDYTDFYASRDHVKNVGTIIRGPENALPPNWLHLPIAYHGRASSVIVSGTDFRRPLGQMLPAGASTPVFGPSQAVDFELEMGCVIGTGNRLGEPIPVDDAWEHVFGMVLVNDWSARDIQKWEYVPLGPFLSKSFATSISPWIVPLDALAPFMRSAPLQDPAPPAYLQETERRTFDVSLEVWLQTAQSSTSHRICQSSLRYLYWSIAQQVAHHTIGGCNLRTGDLLATGTISGPTPGSRGCLLELTDGGQTSLRLPTGEERRFLNDGDRVTLTGWCQGDGYRVGFGEVSGKLLAAHTFE